jgi:hypothetical protein
MTQNKGSNPLAWFSPRIENPGHIPELCLKSITSKARNKGFRGDQKSQLFEKKVQTKFRSNTQNGLLSQNPSLYEDETRDASIPKFR